MKGIGGEESVLGRLYPQTWWLEVAKIVGVTILLAHMVQGKWHYLKKFFLHGTIRKVDTGFCSFQPIQNYSQEHWSQLREASTFENCAGLDVALSMVWINVQGINSQCSRMCKVFTGNIPKAQGTANIK